MYSGESDSAKATETGETRGEFILVTVLRDAIEEAEGFTVANREELGVIP